MPDARSEARTAARRGSIGAGRASRGGRRCRACLLLWKRSDGRREVVILGGGFAGVATARELERVGSAARSSVTLVSRQNFMLFTPMLPEVAAGSIEARDITQPLRAALRAARSSNLARRSGSISARAR